jgi:hypothetical protein
MLIRDADRTSDSPYVERVWRYHSEGGGSFISIAECRSELVVTRHQEHVTVTLRGPETRATAASYPPDAQWLGIRLKPGAFLRSWPAQQLVDRGVNLPEAVRGSFWLDGSAWQVPEYQNVEVFVSRLIHAGLLVIEPAVATALRGELTDVSARTVQRSFRRATGVTRSAAEQIERARYAALLLMRGVPIVDATHEAGYFDQPHLTRSFKRLIGQTPSDVRRQGSLQLSFLYKTEPFASP